MSTLISIIIPVYNSEQYLANCIESILYQDFQNYEIILVNDGSNDNSGNICDYYAQKDQRIKVIHKQNAGAASARKEGVAHAIGDWILFSDSDDTLPQNALSSLIKTAQKYQAFDIISGTYTDGPFTFKHQRSGVLSSSEYICAILKFETYIGPCAKLFKRKLFFKFNWETPQNIIQNEDVLMLIGLASQANNIYIDNDLVCYHFISRKGSASSKSMSLNCWIILFNEIEHFITISNITEKQAFLTYRLRSLLMNLIEKGHFIDYTQSAYLTELINKHKSLNLPENKRILSLLINIQKQKKYYKFYKIKMFFLNRISLIIRYIKLIKKNSDD